MVEAYFTLRELRRLRDSPGSIVYKEKNAVVFVKAGVNSILSNWVHRLGCLKKSGIMISDVGNQRSGRA